MAGAFGRKMIAVALTIALSACNGEPGSGGVTAEEAEQLNEAADMVDVSSDSLTAGEDATLGNGEEAIAEESDTSTADNGAAAE